MFPALHLDEHSETPLYRQVFEQLRDSIAAGRLPRGVRLPPTRELAGQLGLNRATISAAYQQLEGEGLISGHVGRGSFVTGDAAVAADLDWGSLLNPAPPSMPSQPESDVISFAASRPSEVLFPLDEFRAACSEVLRNRAAISILQLGSPGGYPALRRHLTERAREQEILGDGDDLLVTSGCQQALDLITRSLLRPGDGVLLEDPVYPGMRNLFTLAGARVTGVPVTAAGIDIEHLERTAQRERPKLIVITANFQNPTGATMPLANREAAVRIARATGAVLVENDTYGDLRYTGAEIAPAKHLGGHVILKSFSKIAFPGLRVGWAIGPRPLIARMQQAKHLNDLHSDQLSQAVLLRFAESGRLNDHRKRVVTAGAERLRAALSACQRYLPSGATFTRPQGGMNIWVRLPEPHNTDDLLARAQRDGVSYVPGRYFAVSRVESNALRLSFAGLEPDRISRGLEILGRIFSAEAGRVRARRLDSEPALV